MESRQASPGRRWDGDDKGHGIDNGQWIAPDVEALLAELGAFDWIAEGPDAHLEPHLRATCDAADSPWILRDAVLEGSVFTVKLEWLPVKERSTSSIRQLRADAFALLGSIAESTTFVRQRIAGDLVEFWCTTGMVSGDTTFANHGHLVLLRIEVPTVQTLRSSQR